MAKRITEKKTNGIISILSLLIFILTSTLVKGSPQSQQISQSEFSKELSGEYVQNNNQLADSLIKDHRLFVKPFVNDLITESISKELRGKTGESRLAKKIAEKTATSFENIFREKSLTIGVDYLKSWSKEQKGKKLVADSLYALGTKLRGNEPVKAAGIYKEALELYKNIGDERGEAEVLGGFGLIYSTSDGEKSLSFYKEALIARERVDDKLLIGNSLNSIGSIYSSFLKNYQEAIKYFDRAAAIRKEIGDLPNFGKTINNKAITYEKMGQSGQALEFYKQSFEINQLLGDKVRMAESLIKSGTMLIDLGKYPEAINDLEYGLKINRDLNNSQGISDALTQIGFVHLKMGDYNTALEKFNEAIKITKEQNDQWGLAGAYNNLAITLQNVGMSEKALEYYKNALAIYEEQKDTSSVLISLNNIGTVYFDLKDYLTAEEYHKRGLKLSQELQVRDKGVSYLLNLANDQNLLGKTDEALKNYKSGFEIARALNNPDLTWRFIAGLAENYETKKEYDKVVELNDTALKILEDLRSTLPGEDFKTTFMARERYVFEDIIDLLETLYEKDKTKEYDTLAFSYAERSKSRVLLDLLTKSNARIYKENDRRSEALKYPEPVSLKEVQALCPDKNTIILEYSVGDSSSCLWVITQSDHKLYRLPDRKILQEQIETIRFALQEPKEKISEFYTQAANFLYEKLIKPAEPYLSKKSRLIIIPDGVLNYLPFEVLLTENKGSSQRASYSDLPFLVKKYPISYVQSASVLKNLLSMKSESENGRVVDKKLIAFGDPVYENENDSAVVPGKEYQRLKYSGEEVKNIASFFKEGNAEIFLRKDATEENVKREGELKKFNYIHFATHGFIDEAKPDFSSIVLTKDNNSEEDGLLNAAEIFNLKLNADLVVLSACQTGLGKLVRGEGMVGLTRAFMYAGTPTVMVSLWSVSDVSTSTLMGEFYRNLVKEKLGKTEALRKAQLSMLGNEKFAHPFYWAPFVIIGDWR
jgi:CHAT domain-containing protein/Tfp pilus assembly protein PilF